MAEGWRRSVLRVSERLNAEPALRWIQRELASSTRRRDMRDIEHMRLLMRLSLPDDANCVDIGANVGDVLREMVAIAPHGRHVAYEPLADLATDLMRRYPQVDVRSAAVADAPGTATFYRVRRSHSLSSLSTNGRDPVDLEPVQVRVEALDDALERDYAPTLIKIDVEGAECAVLTGARRVLAEHRPIVIFEHGAAAESFAGAPTMEIHGLLSALGYRIFDIDGTGPLAASEFEEVTRSGRIWTFVAHV